MRWDLRGFWVIVRPNPLKLVQVVSAEHGPVSCEILKVVHDDSDEQIDDLTEEQIKETLFVLVVYFNYTQNHSNIISFWKITTMYSCVLLGKKNPNLKKW